MADDAPRPKILGRQAKPVDTSDGWSKEEALTFQEATARHRFGEYKYASDSNNRDVEEARPTTDLEAIMDSFSTLATFVPSLQSQAGAQGHTGKIEELRPTIGRRRGHPRPILPATGRVGAPSKRRAPIRRAIPPRADRTT